MVPHARAATSKGRRARTAGWRLRWRAASSPTRRSPGSPRTIYGTPRASLAISAGANPKVVQRMLGHASAAMTLDVYADLFECDLDAVAQNVSTVGLSAPAFDAENASTSTSLQRSVGLQDN